MRIRARKEGRERQQQQRETLNNVSVYRTLTTLLSKQAHCRLIYCIVIESGVREAVVVITTYSNNNSAYDVVTFVSYVGLFSHPLRPALITCRPLGYTDRSILPSVNLSRRNYKYRPECMLMISMLSFSVYAYEWQ